MENDPLRVGNAKVKEYDDVGHKAKGYGTKSGLLAQDTEAEASKAMSNKLVDANKAVDRLVKIDLNKNQRNALVSLVYNVGATGFGKSNALKELNKGNIKAFLKEAFDPKVGFVRTKGKIVKGLVNRRAREKMIFTKGNYGN
jgi:lysozyme